MVIVSFYPIISPWQQGCGVGVSTEGVVILEGVGVGRSTIPPSGYKYNYLVLVLTPTHYIILL